jgi:hypothetical protein
MSPYERDRYEPRPRHNDDYGSPFLIPRRPPSPDRASADTHSRGYGGYSPRRSHVPPPYPPSRRPPPDPHTFDYPATLKQYAEWFRYFYPQQATEEDSADKAAEQEAADGSKPRNGIKSRWEKYKKEFAANQVSIPLPFFLLHVHCSSACLLDNANILLVIGTSFAETFTAFPYFIVASIDV